MMGNTQMMGLDTGFPDVCLTPTPAGPVPIPYPNLGPGPASTPSQVQTFYMYCPAHNMTTMEPMTQADNAGVNMGVASGTVMGPRRHLTASFTVLVRGAPATKLTSVALHNSTNCPGVRAVPSQVKVILLAP